MNFLFDPPFGLLTGFVLLIGLILLFVLTAFLWYFVHRFLVEYCYLPYARRWCVKNGFEVAASQSFFVFTPSGPKSEYTGFELTCLDGNKQKRFVVLLVGVFGVKRVVSIAEAPLSETRAIPMRGEAPALSQA